MSLDRFKDAQASPTTGFATAWTELRAGRKSSHWIWYIFPQIAGLGRSSAAHFYALRDLDEAIEYLQDPLLQGRLLAALEAVVGQLQQGVQLETLMGGRVDAQKLVSSATLFRRAAQTPDFADADPSFAQIGELCAAVLAAAKARGYPACAFTLERTRG